MIGEITTEGSWVMPIVNNSVMATIDVATNGKNHHKNAGGFIGSVKKPSYNPLKLAIQGNCSEVNFINYQSTNKYVFGFIPPIYGISGTYEPGFIYSNYWDKELAAVEDSFSIDGVSAFITKEMQNINTYSYYLDFKNTWTIYPNSYPVLRWTVDRED